MEELTTYVNCSLWLKEGIAKHLLKGVLVEVYGRMSVSAWINAQGEVKGSLDFHVNNIKLHSKGKPEEKEIIPSPEGISEPLTDLPF